MSTPRLRFKIARGESELEAIYRLNHDTFAEEIGQHLSSPSGRLVDAFDSENTYFICSDERSDQDKLAGMVAVRDRRPFSLDHKLPDLDSLLPAAARPAEVRLLCVRPEYRSSRVLPGLLQLLSQHCLQRGHDLLLISAFVPRLPFYKKLGFEPFGPCVGCEPVLFQPMVFHHSRFEGVSCRLAHLASWHTFSS